MTAKQAAKLKVGDRVYWDNDEADVGTVVETGFNAVKVHWAVPSPEGLSPWTSLLHFEDCDRLKSHKEKVTP